MSRTTKILLGIGTVWPIFYFGLFIVAMLGMAALGSVLEKAGTDPPLVVAIGFGTCMVIHILTMLGMMALQVFFVIHLFTTDRVQGDMKVLWAVLLVLGAFVAEPIYWYLYIWKEPTPVPEARPPSQSLLTKPDRWSRGARIALGIATFWPLVYVSLFGLAFHPLVTALEAGGASRHPELILAAVALGLVHLITILLVMLLLVLYIVHIGTSGRVPKNRMVLWIILVLVGHMLTMPVYWYLYIWRQPRTQSGE